MSQTYPILYAAYGANTNRTHMATRCPTATYVGNCTLHDYSLIFRGVADVIETPRAEVVCAMWEIMPADERALDRFEGFPTHYTKRYARIQFRGKSQLVMFYIMAGDRTDVHEPPRSYEQTLREGYRACGMPGAQIDAAIRDAKQSNSREKRYRGAWVRKDQEQAKPRQGALWSADEYTGYPEWMRRNFNLRTLGDV